MRAITITALALIGSGYGLSSYLTQDTAQIDRTLSAAAEGLVTVRMAAGNIEIEGWDANAVWISGTLTGDSDDLAVTNDHSHTEVRVVPATREDNAAATLMIRVPLGSNLDVETVGADVTVEGVAGVVRLESDGGDLVVRGAPRGIVAQSHTGDIEIAAAGSPGIAHSEEGAVTLVGAPSRLVASGVNAGAGCHWQPRHTGRGQGSTLACVPAYSAPLGRLQRDLQSLVQQVLEGIHLTGSFDIDDRDARLRFDLSGDIGMNPDDLQDLVDDFGEFFEDLQDELSDEMILMGEQLEDLGGELRRSGTDVARFRR